MTDALASADPAPFPYWTAPSFIDVAGTRTAYRRAGAGETVLFLHGGGLTQRWLPFHQALAAEVDLIAPEHPGFGDSDRPDSLRDFSDVVLHYDALLDALGLEGVHLVGTSLGGRIAAHLATVYPRRFRSLTLVVPAGLRGDSGRPDPFRQSPEAALELLTNGRADRMADAFVGRDFPDDVLDAYREQTTLALLTFTERYDAKLPSRLGRVVAPTLVIDAEEDRVLGRGDAARYAELISGAEYLVVPGPARDEPSSHVVHLEQPDAVAAEIVRHVTQSAA